MFEFLRGLMGVQHTILAIQIAFVIAVIAFIAFVSYVILQMARYFVYWWSRK